MEHRYTGLHSWLSSHAISDPFPKDRHFDEEARINELVLDDASNHNTCDVEVSSILEWLFRGRLQFWVLQAVAVLKDFGVDRDRLLDKIVQLERYFKSLTVCNDLQLPIQFSGR